jgi:hypothetical protein
MAGPAILSALGPFYYGYTGGPYLRIIVWALGCTVALSWWSRSSFEKALATAPPSVIGRSLLVVLIVTSVALAFVVGDSLVFFARAFTLEMKALKLP